MKNDGSINLIDDDTKWWLCCVYYSGNGEGLDVPDAGAKVKHDPHILVEFADSDAAFTCKVYFAEEFHRLRNIVYPPGEEK